MFRKRYERVWSGFNLRIPEKGLQAEKIASKLEVQYDVSC